MAAAVCYDGHIYGQDAIAQEMGPEEQQRNATLANNF